MAQPTDIPVLDLSGPNRHVLLVRRPTGIPQTEDFALAESPVPEPGEGQFLVRNVFLSVDPAQRGWVSAEVNYSAPVALGTPMRALAVGVVVRSRDPEVAEGDCLYGWFDWQHYAVADKTRIVARARHALPLSAFAGPLGINGLTAYLALTTLGRPEPGETLLVSTAAGAVGGFVGQIGAMLGCKTIGMTGSDDKVRLCRERLGYAEAFNYKIAIGTPDGLSQELIRAMPEGIDVFFDNTGGPMLDTALRRMRVGGRVVQCGTVSVPQWTPPPMGLRNEREVLTRRLSWSGFVIFDHAPRFAKAMDQLAEWVGDGRLVYQEDVSVGLEHAPGAIAGLYAGENSGKRLIRVV
ncbi:NADP-dependent oxidoreductase [Azospirillum sp. YIM B02556]|uniref:NADP-dependent oxidoreductase n=1 Tax=Azospirillum endophyticum TaxID=2800326 RepID=A0ABS1EZH7_9PROT|nr:NADP-dependent oxidoreductase [Azospirillum endophyticum]MBK1836551.1 NADP-dependent oxidoreductase [Azospirillum endophyticum]